MFRNAQIVFTGTFHGAVFSIKSKKNFYCYLSNPSRIKKVNSLLKQFEIKDRILIDNGSHNNIEEKNINYGIVYKKIDVEKNKSLEYLKKSIN